MNESELIPVESLVTSQSLHRTALIVGVRVGTMLVQLLKEGLICWLYGVEGGGGEDRNSREGGRNEGKKGKE